MPAPRQTQRTRASATQPRRRRRSALLLGVVALGLGILLLPYALVPLYHIDRVRFGARELSHVIAQSCDAMRLAVAALQSRSGVLEHAVEINRLENEADRLHQRAVGQLFDEEHDPIAVMKWKEILDLLEDATDRTEDVANLLENIVVKHG